MSSSPSEKTHEIKNVTIEIRNRTQTEMFVFVFVKAFHIQPDILETLLPAPLLLHSGHSCQTKTRSEPVF